MLNLRYPQSPGRECRVAIDNLELDVWPVATAPGSDVCKPQGWEGWFTPAR